jgi:peroxiredoxin
VALDRVHRDPLRPYTAREARAGAPARSGGLAALRWRRYNHGPMATAEPTPRLAPLIAQVAFVAVAALFVYGFVSVSKEGETRRLCSAPCYLHPDYLGADRRAPNFTLKDIHGATVSLESFRGRVVILNFWTKTCGPCLKEMPELSELTKMLHDRPDVVVLAVSIDDGPDDVKPTLQTILREEPPFDVLFDPDSNIVGSRYGTRLFPETWFIDKRGVIRARFDGAREWSGDLVVNFIDELRAGDYCDARIDGPATGGSSVCNEVTGS